MNRQTPHYRLSKLDVTAAAVIGCLAAYLLAGETVDAWPFEDTANYFSVARSVAGGNGFQTDLIYYPEQSSFNSIPAPQTVFPPGYSVVLAAVARTFGWTIERSAQVVCLISYACSTVLLLSLCIFAGLQRRSAWLIVAVWLSTASVWVYTWSAASEPLFVVLTMTAVLFCSSSKTPWWPWIVAGIATALAFSLRYVGVFLMLTLGLTALRDSGLQLRRLLRCTIPLLALSAVLMGMLFLRNHLLIGSWRGGNEYASQPFTDVLVVFYYAVCRIVGFSKTALLRGEFVSVALLIGSGGLLLAISGSLSMKRLTDWFRNLDLRKMTIVLYGPVSLTLLFYLDMTSNSGMTTRLLLPTMPFFLLSLAMIVEGVQKSGQWQKRLANISVACMIMAFILGQQTSLAEFHHDARTGRAVLATLKQPVSSGETLAEFLQERMTVDSPLLSCQPQLAHFYLKRPLLGLPTTYFDKAQRQWTEKRTAEYATKFGVGYVLLLTHPDVRNDAEFFVELHRGLVPEWLEVVEEGPDYRLFQLTRPMSPSSLRVLSSAEHGSQQP